MTNLSSSTLLPPPPKGSSLSSQAALGCGSHPQYPMGSTSSINLSHLSSPLCGPQSFPGDSGIKNPPASAGDTSLIPGWGRSPRRGNGNPLPYSCLENPMDRGSWQATVHGVTKRVGHDWTTTVGLKSFAWLFQTMLMFGRNKCSIVKQLSFN